MSRSNCPARSRSSSRSPLLVNDLCAQLAPLNLYGLVGVSSAVVDGLLALVRRATPNHDEGASAGH
jgi:hypothetical protein